MIKDSIVILGGGWYGCHLARALLKMGYSVALYESTDRLFNGASGNMPARLHLGFHYPRSYLTRSACQDHYAKFMCEYGFLTRGVPINIYAVAEHRSMVDFGNYRQILKGEVEYVTIADPRDYGLLHVEGAVLTGERHVLVHQARAFFEEQLGSIVKYNCPDTLPIGAFVIDCTFCARDNQNVDRYEPCVTALVEGPSHKAVTIMDGPFPSLYPWDETKGLSSLTSALLTPISKACKTWAEARKILDETDNKEIVARANDMIEQMAYFYPFIREGYRLHGVRLAVRAMPLSGADARLVDVVRVDETCLRIRASKLDAIFYAEDVVKETLRCL